LTNDLPVVFMHNVVTGIPHVCHHTIKQKEARPPLSLWYSVMFVIHVHNIHWKKLNIVIWLWAADTKRGQLTCYIYLT